MEITKEKKVVYSGEKYQPITKLTSESRQLLSYQSLEVWSKKLCDLFDGSILPSIGSSILSQNSNIEVLVNQYTFILAFKGDMIESKKALEMIIEFWSKRYIETHDNDCLLKLLQPSVNLARLFILNNNNVSFWKTHKELTPKSDNEFIMLGGLKINKCLVSSHLKFLSQATFTELLKAYLKTQKLF